MTNKRWKPKDGEEFWCVLTIGKVLKERFATSHFDKLTLSFGNCFKTEKQAQKAAKIVKAALLKFHEEVLGE